MARLKRIQNFKREEIKPEQTQRQCHRCSAAATVFSYSSDSPLVESERVVDLSSRTPACEVH